MAPLVLLVLLSADGDVSAVASTPEREPRVVIDFTPNATLIPLATGATLDAVLINVPVSVTWVLGPTTALYAELAVAYAAARLGPPGGTVGFSIGPLFSFGPSALRGFFICPKLGVQFSNAVTVLFPVLAANANNGPIDLGPAWSRAFLAGVDIGYQWTWGRQHIAFMVGGSFGYEYDNAGPWVDPLGLQRGDASSFAPPARNQGFAFSLNGNLMRLGFAL